MIKSDIIVLNSFNSIAYLYRYSSSKENKTIEKPSRYLGGVGWRLIIEEAQLQ